MATNDHTIDVKVKADTTGLSKGLSDASKELDKAGQGFSKYGTNAEQATTATKGATAQNEKFGTSVKASGAATLAARESARQYASSLDGVEASLQKNGKTLDITTAAGRANQAALDGIAGAGLRSADAMKKAGASQAEVEAHLRGVNDSLTAAGEKFGMTGKAARATAGDLLHASQGMQGFIDKNRGKMESMGKEAMIMGGAIGASVGLAVHAYSEFSGRMAQVQSLSHASAAEMGALTNSALTMGTAFGLSANDVADAEIELVKAGISVKEMMGGALPGALALAAAGQIGVGKATEIATIALTQFNLKGKDVPHVADLLAAGADKALGGVSELGDALKQGGLVAAQFGLTIDDTVGTLSAFANAGLLGSDAGTSLKTMFLQLASPSKQQADMMAQMGINAYDLQGKFIGVTALAGQLHDKLGPLSDAQRNNALSTIFGTDAMRAASVLMKEGSTGIQKWISDVNDQGFAAQQAAGKMNSLNGDFKKLQASFETGLIKMGSSADGSMRPMIQQITSLITWFNNLDPAVQSTIFNVAKFTGTTLLVGGALVSTIPKVYDTVKAFKALEESSPRLSEAIKGVGKAALIATGLIVALHVAQAIGKNFETGARSAEEMAQAMIGLNKNGAQAAEVFGKDMFKSSNGRQFVQDLNGIGDAIKQVSQTDWVDNVNDFGNALLGVVGLHKDSQLDKTRESIKGIDSAMANFVGSGSVEIASTNFRKMAEEAGKQGVKTEEVAKVMPLYMDSLRRLSTEMKVRLTDEELLNWALGEVPQKMKDAQNSTEGQAKAAEVAAKQTEAQQKALDNLGLSADGTILHLDKLVQSMIASGLLSLSARDAARNFEKALDDLDVSIAKNGRSLDITTQKGRDNQAAFDGIAGAGLKSAEAMAKNGESQVAVQGNLQGTYDALIRAAEKFGITGAEADGLARKVMGIPGDVPINTAIQNFADTMAKAQAIKTAVDSINDRNVMINIRHMETYEKRVADSGGNEPEGGGLYGSDRGRASGGPIYGSGPKGIDSEWYKLAPGEHVWTAAEVDAAGGQSAVRQLRNAALTGGVRPSYATPAPSNAWAPVTTQAGGGDVHAEFTINQVDDPIGTSHAVVRRLSSLVI